MGEIDLFDIFLKKTNKNRSLTLLVLLLWGLRPSKVIHYGVELLKAIYYGVELIKAIYYEVKGLQGYLL